MRERRISIGAVIVALALLSAAASGLGVHVATAQDAPPVPPAPEVSPQDQQLVADLQIRAQGLAVAMAVLQREQDVINAEFGRVVTRLQQAAPAGYELTQGPQGLVYVRREPDK